MNRYNKPLRGTRRERRVPARLRWTDVGHTRWNDEGHTWHR